MLVLFFILHVKKWFLFQTIVKENQNTNYKVILSFVLSTALFTVSLKISSVYYTTAYYCMCVPILNNLQVKNWLGVDWNTANTFVTGIKKWRHLLIPNFHSFFGFFVILSFSWLAFALKFIYLLVGTPHAQIFSFSLIEFEGTVHTYTYIHITYRPSSHHLFVFYFNLK